ncbi:MAG TPA: isochorismate synthase, partial [Nitriliruptorales bacterium]|nr:isochorismate synthase [Nitriliruptorales bacterium]
PGGCRARPVTVGTTVRTERVHVAGELLSLLPPTAGLAWLRRGEGLVGWGEAARVDPGTGDERFLRAARALRALADDADTHDPVGRPGTGLVAFASFTFDPRAPGSLLVVPQVTLGRRGRVGWRTTVGAGGAPELVASPLAEHHGERIRSAGSSLPDVAWLEAVAGAVHRIAAGELDKVVLARDHTVWSRAPFDARVLARRLAARFPDCWTFLCEGLLGATPELLIRRTERRVASLVLAGSAARGADPDEDRRLGEDLLASKKDRHEHELAVASVREVLAPRCLRLRLDDEPSLLRLANVQHLATRVSGTLGEDATALELAGALHPTAAVGGVPTEVALRVIRELEGMQRGRYAAPVGWVDARGDGEFGIALRCAELDGARARLFAGSGIVAGSLPEDELEETWWKLRAMQSAFQA